MIGSMDVRSRQAIEADATQLRAITAPFCEEDSAVSLEIVPAIAAGLAELRPR